MAEIETKNVYLENVSQNHYKFYEISISNKTVTTIFGCIGHIGTKKVKQFQTSDLAHKFYYQQIKQKLKGGYEAAIKGKSFPKLKFICLDN